MPDGFVDLDLENPVGRNVSATIAPVGPQEFAFPHALTKGSSRYVTH